MIFIAICRVARDLHYPSIFVKINESFVLSTADDVITEVMKQRPSSISVWTFIINNLDEVQFYKLVCLRVLWAEKMTIAG